MLKTSLANPTRQNQIKYFPHFFLTMKITFMINIYNNKIQHGEHFVKVNLLNKCFINCVKYSSMLNTTFKKEKSDCF